VPWFVTWLDDQGRPTANGHGTPDFRVVTRGRIAVALRLRLCWICGGKLGSHKAFVIGPMCAVNRISSEPPQHLACATFAATACPFLVNPHQRRRDTRLPDGTGDADGVMIRRNPGVALVWVTRAFSLVPAGAGGSDPNGILFHVGTPESTLWFCEGRPATRDEIVASIDSGVALLRPEAIREGPASIAQLDGYVARAMALVPGGPS